MDNGCQPQLTGHVDFHRGQLHGRMPVGAKDLSGNNSGPASACDLNDINELVQNHRPSVLRYALSRLRDRDLAETVTQDCFMRAFRYRGDFRGECSVRTWLFNIAKNLICDYTRSKRFRFWKQADAVAVALTEVHDRVASPQQTPEAELLAKERLARMRHIVDSLPKRQNEILRLRFAEGMSLSEIARTVGMTMSATKSQLYRGIRTIRTRTQDHAQPSIRGATVSECFLLYTPQSCEVESQRLVVG